jgi:hypothetical protein
MKVSLFSTAGAEDTFASDVTKIFAIGLAVKVMSPPSRGGPTRRWPVGKIECVLLLFCTTKIIVSRHTHYVDRFEGKCLGIDFGNTSICTKGYRPVGPCIRPRAYPRPFQKRSLHASHQPASPTGVLGYLSYTNPELEKTDTGRDRPRVFLQGYLAHKKTPIPLGSP